MNTKKFEERKQRLQSLINAKAPPIIISWLCESVLLTFHGSIWRFIWHYFAFKFSVSIRVFLMRYGLLKDEVEVSNGIRD